MNERDSSSCNAIKQFKLISLCCSPQLQKTSVYYHNQKGKTALWSSRIRLFLYAVKMLNWDFLFFWKLLSQITKLKNSIHWYKWFSLMPAYLLQTNKNKKLCSNNSQIIIWRTKAKFERNLTKIYLNFCLTLKRKEN